MSKWFKGLENRHKVRIFEYLDKLSHIKNRRLKVETMMHEMKYHEPFCTECVEEWHISQDKKALREIQDKDGPPNTEFQNNLF